VSSFLAEEIPFPKIWETVAATMRDHTTISHPSLDEIINADLEARSLAQEYIA
jgi:1-deoxy-D-xylulose-5-phosphate reductoisomerase